MSVALTAAIPNFNMGAQVRHAVASVLSVSTSRSGVKVVVVDNASTDDSRDTLQSAFGSDSRVQLFFEPDHVSGPKNCHRAVSKSETPWTVLLSADDILLPWFLELQSPFFGDPAVGAVSTNAIATRRTPQGEVNRLVPNSTTKRYSRFDIDTVMQTNPFPLCATSFRTELYRSLGGFDSALNHYGDWDLWLRILLAGKEIVSIPHCGAVYSADTGSWHKLVGTSAELEELVRWRRARSGDLGADSLKRFDRVIAERALTIGAGAAATGHTEDVTIATNCAETYGGPKDAQSARVIRWLSKLRPCGMPLPLVQRAAFSRPWRRLRRSKRSERA